MKYKNPKIPEGINVSKEHPLKDFFAMLIGVIAAILIVIVILSFIAEYMVRFIPFEVEQALAERFQQSTASQFNQVSNPSNRHQQIEQYLQQLANQLAKAQSLPEDMPITIHYIETEEVNALATLGGHIMIFRGLLEKMPNENALAMVIAHEIAHIHNRDPIVAMGRGVTVSIALLAIMGAGDGAVSQQLINQVGLLTSLNFSRQHEEEADALAIQTLDRHYGHIKSADTIFKIFMEQENSLNPPAFLSTHPLNERRIKKVTQHPSSKKAGTNKPLPSWMSDLLQPLNLQN